MIITKKNIWIEISKGNYLEVLKSDLVDTIKDNYGWTPLHVLSVDKVKNSYDETPLYYLALNDHLTKEDLRKKYPWYKKEIKDIKEAITEIVNTPDSVRFILED